MRTPCVVALLAIGVSIAKAGPEEDRARAQELFKQGRELQKQGQEQAACDKFDDALKLDKNAIGVILNVARCDEEAGKVASAARLFEDARARARELQEPDSPLLRTAGDHIDQLKPEIPYLAVAFLEPPTADTSLVINDLRIDVTQAGHVPVDPGTAKVTVSRPGRVPYEANIAIGRREQKAIIIPKLAYPVVVNPRRRTIGKVVIASGGAVVIGGIITGLVARSVYHTAYVDGGCRSQPSGPALCANPLEEEKANNMVSLGNASNWIVAAGAAAIVTGGYLWLFGKHEERVALAPDVGPDHAGLVAAVRF